MPIRRGLADGSDQRAHHASRRRGAGPAREDSAGAGARQGGEARGREAEDPRV